MTGIVLDNTPPDSWPWPESGEYTGIMLRVHITFSPLSFHGASQPERGPFSAIMHGLCVATPHVQRYHRRTVRGYATRSALSCTDCAWLRHSFSAIMHGLCYQVSKFLPCFHTFCSSCIQSVADSNSADGFPCPVCETRTSLPPGGVAYLQTNSFVIRNEDHHEEVVPVNSDMCTTHNDNKTEFFCKDCDEPVCKDCVLKEHENHKTETLTTAVSHKKTEIEKERPRLQGVLSDLGDNVASLQEEKSTMGKKITTLERDLLNRHGLIISAADEMKDRVLASLKSQHISLVNDIDQEIAQQESFIGELGNLFLKVKGTLDSGTDDQILAVAKDVTSGLRNQRAMDVTLSSRRARMLQRPFLHYNISTSHALETITRFLGWEQKVNVRKAEPEMTVTERFHCEQNSNVEVFSLCYLDGNVVVSYEFCGMDMNAHVKEFKDTGLLVKIHDKKGKLSCRRFAENVVVFLDNPGRCHTYNKSPTAAHFSLQSKASRRAEVMRHTVISQEPFKYEINLEFTIRMGLFRTFDVDDTEQYLAVVDFAKSSTNRRSVHLFRHSEEMSVCTYEPPSNCQLTDVCFYTLRGQKVLLITDEHMDAIHVVTIEEDSLYFVRYLCVDSPSLIQPTAITVDLQDHLWVACRGGAILMLEQEQITEEM
ncbi:hypothetical protein ACOMHN_034146 [Nucella lapillus]